MWGRATYICLEVWVCQRLLNSDTLFRVECLISTVNKATLSGSTRSTHQALREEVYRQRACIREELCKRLALAEGQCADVVARSARGDRVELVKRWRTEHVEDQRQLVVVVAPREERLAREHLREDAPDRPDVNSLKVQVSQQP